MQRSHAIALIGAAILAAPPPVRAQERPLRVGFSASGESLAEGAYLQDGGIFAKAGIEVELVPVNNGGAMTAAIVSGAIDIAPSNVASIAAAYVRGLHLDLFAPSVEIAASAPATTVLSVASDSPIRSARDMAGKTVGCNTLRDLQQSAVMTWLDKNGGDAHSVSFVEIPNPDQLGALAAKRIDAACLVEPFISSPRNDTRVIGRPYDSLAPVLMTFGWIANGAWYDAHHDLAKRVAAALRTGARWANANQAQTAAINAKYSGVPVGTLLSEHRQIFSDRALDPTLIQPIIDASARYGFLPRSFAATELFAKPAV